MVGFFVCLFWFDFYSHRTKEKSSCSFKSHQRAGYCHGYNHQTWGNMVRRGWPILPGVKPFGNSVVSQCHRASCAWHRFTRKTKLSPRQLWGCQPWHSLQSWVAAHCWHVQFWALGGKKNPHRNVEPGKDSRCPSYISCSGTFWKNVSILSLHIAISGAFTEIPPASLPEPWQPDQSRSNRLLIIFFPKVTLGNSKGQTNHTLL